MRPFSSAREHERETEEGITTTYMLARAVGKGARVVACEASKMTGGHTGGQVDRGERRRIVVVGECRGAVEG